MCKCELFLSCAFGKWNNNSNNNNNIILWNICWIVKYQIAINDTIERGETQNLIALNRVRWPKSQPTEIDPFQIRMLVTCVFVWIKMLCPVWGKRETFFSVENLYHWGDGEQLQINHMFFSFYWLQIDNIQWWFLFQ